MIDTIDQIIDTVFSLYEIYGNTDHDGGSVSQLEHMAQTAQLAMRDGWDNEVVLAAFFHDIGHLCMLRDGDHATEDCDYEQTGADYLREKGFPEKIAKLVEDHANAKRYLLYRYPQYYPDQNHQNNSTLFSDDTMNEMEAFLFENDPLFEISIALCQWDELAKEADMPVMIIDILKRKAKKVLTANRSTFALYE